MNCLYLGTHMMGRINEPINRLLCNRHRLEAKTLGWYDIQYVTLPVRTCNWEPAPISFEAEVASLLHGTTYRINIKSNVGSVEIVCDKKFRDDISKLAWYHLAMGISLYLNGECIPYYKEGMERMAAEEKKEAINHPSHYGGDTPYEVIKVMEQWLTVEEFIGAMKFQIFKYTARANKKGNPSEDHAKSAWYDNYLTEYLKRKNAN